VTEEEIYVVLGIFILIDVIQKPIFWSHFFTKKVSSVPHFGDVITRQHLKLIWKLLNITANEKKHCCCNNSNNNTEEIKLQNKKLIT
jgi:hypothetical protein